MARCASAKGAGSTLVCCRRPHDDENHHWHWVAFMHGISEPHRYASRVMDGRLFVCSGGAEMDGEG